MIIATHARAFCLRNMSSPDVVPIITFPWEHPLPPMPEFPNKAAYKAWMARADTSYLFYSLVEGKVSSVKLSKENRPHRVHGVIGDYDTGKLTPTEISQGLKRASASGNLPTAWHTTRSGSVRVVWMFEEPVWFYNHASYRKLIRRCRTELHMDQLFPGLDERALERPEQYYTSAPQWGVLGGVIPVARVHFWQGECLTDDEFDEGLVIPLDVIATEAEARFPGRWTAEWRLGARGVRFWDPSADANAAILRPTGVQCFTGDSPFMRWQDIFGQEFVKKFQEDRTGAATRDLYFDGLVYYRQLPDDTWDPMSVLQAKRHLGVAYGLNAGKEEGEATSEVERALHRIEIAKRVAGALPFPHRPERVVRWNGVEYLNTSNARLWPPALEPQEWGENFPWIASYTTRLFRDEDSLLHFLAWLQAWIRPTYEGKPGLGTSLFIAGPPNTGKTFMTRVILSRIVGGFADVSSFFVEGNRFNSDAFAKALWCLDDSTPAADRQAHRRFSALIKALAANGSMRYERKYGYCGQAPFLGRFVCTLNNDPISISVLPDTDQSLLDKVTLVTTGEEPPDMDPNEQVRYQIVERELGAFVRWLLDWEAPDSIERDTRFGVAAWHDRGLLQSAREASASSATLETLRIWASNYRAANPDATEWLGSSSALLAAMHAYDGCRGLVNNLNPVTLGRTLSQLSDHGVAAVRRTRVGRTKLAAWRINLKDL